jgi:hypothetical protein
MARVMRRAQRAAALTGLLIACLAFAASVARADAGWFESGDAQLRLDLQLLNDAEIIRYPISQWPVPRAGLEYAVGRAKEHFATNAAVQAALERVRARIAASPTTGRFSAEAHAGEAGLLRDFDSLAREDGEISGRYQYSSGRFAVGLSATVVADPEDGQQVRGDGSHLTAQFGNWLVSANTLDRWWGPGHDGSLILSNNARPMPTLMVERAEARPFESRWLSWLGPWRFNFALSHMEHERQDTDSPLFMAWRVAIMPFKDIEVGFSRTAQFCGKGLRCTASSFWDLLIGNDNPGFDATPENEPGNQMAGFDLRWASPIGNGPYAFYGQYIGEDESGYLPVKYLGQLGLEAWKPFARGGVLQGFVEYANTTCSGMSGGRPRYDCAYTQGKFNVEGYRYRGRVIGHTTDSDAESVALGATFADMRGAVWSATARSARLNHDGVDPRNTVSAGPADYAALELGWRGRWLRQSLAIELGVESLEPLGGERDLEPYGFLGWRHDFDR